jgi:two-component system, sensor histidine kinase and response regulator
MAGSNIINVPELAERVDNDFELFIELSELFFDDSVSLINKISDSINKGDPDALRKTAHTLKGAVSNFSAQSAYDAAYDLEIVGKNNELESADKKFNLLKREIDLVVQEMKSMIEKGSF